MKNTKRAAGTVDLTAILNTLFLILLSSIAAFAQSDQTGTLIRDDLIHGLYGIGPAYTDYTVPDAGTSPYLTLTARGGDGGKVWIEDLGRKTSPIRPKPDRSSKNKTGQLPIPKTVVYLTNLPATAQPPALLLSTMVSSRK